MPALDLSIDELLTTTRAVRKRLDLSRPVEKAVIEECLALAVQAPTPGDLQNWHFMVVTDPSQRAALADLYRRGAVKGQHDAQQAVAAAADAHEAAARTKVADSAQYLVEHLHEVPVHVIPCVEGRPEQYSSATEQAALLWGAILPAAWSFMLAARSRGLGTVLTAIHLDYEREAAAVLGIPYERVMQVGLIPVAYTLGTNFRPAPRKPLASVLHWNRW